MQQQMDKAEALVEHLDVLWNGGEVLCRLMI